MDVAGFLGWAGVLNAALMALVTAMQARRDRRAAWLAALFGGVSAAIAAILFSQASHGIERSAWLTAEFALTLAAGPTLYHYLRAATGRPIRPAPTAAHYLPAAAFLVASGVMAAGGRVIDLHIGWAVASQMVYTAAAILLFLRRDPADRSTGGFLWPVVLLVMMAAVHAGQVARLTGVAGGADRGLVPMIGGLGLLAALVLALAAAQGAHRAAARRYARSGLDETALHAIHARAVAALVDGRLYRDMDLGLDALAEAAGEPAHRLSQAFSHAGSSFPEAVAAARVADAMAALADPANARAAVEAIGMEAGFRSRSAFYAAFGKAAGMSPAAYRRRALAGAIVSAPAGQDTASEAGTAKGA